MRPTKLTKQMMSSACGHLEPDFETKCTLSSQPQAGPLNHIPEQQKHFLTKINPQASMCSTSSISCVRRKKKLSDYNPVFIGLYDECWIVFGELHPLCQKG